MISNNIRQTDLDGKESRIEATQSYICTKKFEKKIDKWQVWELTSCFFLLLDQITSTLGARGQKVISLYLAQASQAYVTSVLYKRVGVALQATVETLCKRNKILWSVKECIFTFFSTKKIKETYL